MASAKTRGHPPIPVRADPTLVDRWKEASGVVGSNLSAWTRATLNAEADRILSPPTAEQVKAQLERTMGRSFGQVAAEVQEAAADTCPHPKDQRRRMSYGTVCDRCGRMLS